MAYIYKLDNNWISSALMPLETVFSNVNIQVSTNSVNFFADSDIALGLNIGSRRIAYKHNNILFKTATMASGENNITFVTRPSIERGFVQWQGEFNRLLILKDLLGLDFTASPNIMEFTISVADKTLFSLGDNSFTISWSDTEIAYNDVVFTGSQQFTSGEITFTVIAEELLARLNGDFSGIAMINYGTPETPFDLSHSVIDGSEGIYEEREIVLDYNALIFDEFGHQYFSVPNYNFGVSQSAVWFPGGSDKYISNDQFSFVLPAQGGGVFAEFNKDRLRSAVNTGTLYQEGLIECSVKTYIGYARVYTRHIYVDYYYIKSNTAEDECARLEDTVSYGRACRLKIADGNITILNIDSTLAHVSLVENAQSMAHDAYDKMRFGIGSFKSNYKLYSYRDKRNTLEVIFNRETSSKYVKVIIEDQPTRYQAVVTVASGTLSTTKTLNFNRYSTNALWSIGNTGYINLILKRALDNVSDTTETLFTNGAITLNPDTIKILTRTLYVNILEQVVPFPQINLTYDTLSVIAWPDGDGAIQKLQINYQPATGAIYGRIAQGSSYDYFEKDAMLEMLNTINENYAFALTCNISSLRYADLDGNEHVYPFTNSTIIIAEAVNGIGGQFYRVYYKNADSYGFVVAKSYFIEE